jgi:hypothetical protein
VLSSRSPTSTELFFTVCGVSQPLLFLNLSFPPNPFCTLHLARSPLPLSPPGEWKSLFIPTKFLSKKMRTRPVAGAQAAGVNEDVEEQFAPPLSLSPDLMLKNKNRKKYKFSWVFSLLLPVPNFEVWSL